MAYDGLFIRSQIIEYKKILLNKKISKIFQYDNRNFSLLFKENNKDLFLMISLAPDFPVIKITYEEEIKNLNPPAFCMLLRKYLSGGEITNINQIDGIDNFDSFERIVDLTVNNITEKGNIANFHLITELMGRYSNIIICDDNYIIIDALFKINSVENERIIKPKIKYTTDTLLHKKELKNITFDDFFNIIYTTFKNNTTNNLNFTDILLKSFVGISKSYINDLLFKNDTDENLILNDLKTYEETKNREKSNQIKKIYDNIKNDIKNILNEKINPTIFFDNKKAKDFHVIDFSIYNEKEHFDNVNNLINNYCKLKHNNNIQSNIKTLLQSDIKNIIKHISKKIEINETNLKNATDFDKYRIYGELINTYGYNNELIKDNNLICTDFYSGKIVKIPLDNSVSINKNAEKYFNKYNKLKRTIEKSNELLIENNDELKHINSINDELIYINDIKDLQLIKQELDTFFKSKNEKGNISKNKKSFSINIKHYKTQSGIDVYLGKNNIQNEYLTFNMANPNDTWFHIKNATGAHVIAKKAYQDMNMKDVEDIASLAGYYSSLRNENKVSVDYTLRKELKKVKGKAPGFCIYHKNYSITVKPTKTLKELN